MPTRATRRISLGIAQNDQKMSMVVQNSSERHRDKDGKLQLKIILRQNHQRCQRQSACFCVVFSYVYGNPAHTLAEIPPTKVTLLQPNW